MSKNLKKTYLLGFLFALSIALVSYINSSFLEEFLGKKYEGLLFTLGSLITILLMIVMPKILNCLGNKKTILILSFGTIIALLIMGTISNIWIIIMAFLIYLSFSNLIIMNLDIFVEDFSKNQNIGKYRGLYLAIANIGWVLSQLISGKIIEIYSYKGVYLFSSLFVIGFFFILFFSMKNFKDPTYTKISFIKTAKIFWQKRDLARIYFVNFILKFFFAWMVIYTPIYLHENLLLEWETIGFIFAIMLTPFVFLSYPLGKFSDKIGEKEMLFLGFVIIIISTLSIPFLDGNKIWLLALVLFMTRVGASTIEVMSESFFFKSIKEENADELSFFRTNTPLAYIIAPIIATFTLIVFSNFKFIFLILSIILLLGLLTSLKLKDTN